MLHRAAPLLLSLSRRLRLVVIALVLAFAFKTAEAALTRAEPPPANSVEIANLTAQAPIER